MISRFLFPATVQELSNRLEMTTKKIVADVQNVRNAIAATRGCSQGNGALTDRGIYSSEYLLLTFILQPAQVGT